MKSDTKFKLFFIFTICVAIAGMLVAIFTQHILGLCLIMAFAFLVLILMNIPAENNKEESCKDK